MPPARSLVTAAAGGVLYFLGYLGWGWWPCLFVFLAPLWIALDGDPRETTRHSALRGGVFGIVAYAGGFLWLWPLVDAFLGGSRMLGAVLWTGYGLWFALGFVVYAAAFHVIRRRGWPIAVAGIPPLIVLEWLQPQLFPVYAGAALVDVSAAAQIADLGGPLLLTSLLGIANVAAFDTWRWWRGDRPRPRATWATAAVVAACTLGYGTWRMRTVDTAMDDAPALRVGLVQANLGRLEKQRRSVVTHRRHLELTREMLAAGSVDLVVWPETAYVRGLRRPLPISGGAIREDVDVPILFGAGTVRDQAGRRLRANSALLVDADGLIRHAYDKNLLIPFTEYVPLGGLVPGLRALFPDVQEFSAATDTPALVLGPWRIATPICYEAIRPDLVRRMMRSSRPHLLVTLANDGWFGDSAEPWIHLSLARLRAIEHRRWLVRATNSGVSAIVDPCGRVTAHTGLLTRTTLRGTVRLLDGETPYGRFGDWPAPLAAAVMLFGALRRRRG